MKQLLLVGAGHAHLGVLMDFARERPPGLKATLLTPAPRTVYSGMVPGVVAGHYTPRDATIDVEPLARAAGVTLRLGALAAFDAGTRTVTTGDGDALQADVVSLDCGGVADTAAIDGAAQHALFARPIDVWLDRLGDIDARLAAGGTDVVVVGGGAAGFELALALQHRSAATGTRVALVTGGGGPLAGYPRRVVERGRRALQRQRVTVFEDLCASVDAAHVRLRSGAAVRSDLTVIATASAAPAWLAASGLQRDDRGFVATTPRLQSASHAGVFAAGDIASRIDRRLPKSGVFAVRAGPALALNLRRALAGGELQAWDPPKRTLNLLSCGSRHAIAAWGDWQAEGAWVWRWKDRIDRRFVARRPAASSGG